MRKILLSFVILVAIAGVWYRYYTITQPMVVQMKLPTTATAQEEEEIVANPFAIEALSSGLEVKSTAALYSDYSESAVQKSLDDGNKVILFFHASRCPICRKFDKELNDQLDQVPSDVAIFKVNYDKENALKQKYDIKIQHTLISIDSDWNKTDLSIDPSIQTLLGLID